MEDSMFEKADVVAAIVVRSSLLSGPQLVQILGLADRAWTLGERKSARSNGWEIREVMSGDEGLDQTIVRLFSRAIGSRPALEELRRNGDIDTPALWIWVQTVDQRAGLSLKPDTLAHVAELGACIQISVLCGMTPRT